MRRIAYLFTTFPKLSERFFLREVLELRRQGVAIDLYSMWGGAAQCEAGAVRLFRFTDWCALFFELVRWLRRRPGVTLGLLRQVIFQRYGSWTNYGENLLGLAFGLRFAERFSSAPEDLIPHATWATAPGMAALTIRRLTGLAYTMEAHAYDVFRDGGDRFLVEKLKAARALRTSTEATEAALRERIGSSGAIPIHCVRRGVESVPTFRAPKAAAGSGSVVRFVSVGRLIEKKGYFDTLEIFEQLEKQGFAFEAAIIGQGPLMASLAEAVADRGLADRVRLVGRLDYAAVEAFYQRSDAFIFTGRISRSGDRDGFPNVIGEAMAQSLPVFSTAVSGTVEGVVDGERGTVIDAAEPAVAAQRIRSVMADAAYLKRTTLAAHAWVRSEFNTAVNVSRLRARLWDSDQTETAAAADQI